MAVERRTQKRTFRIIPIRYKKKEEPLFTVGDIINLTDNGFCLLMPIHLEVNRASNLRPLTAET
jgi:hypothetical protein